MGGIVVDALVESGSVLRRSQRSRRCDQPRGTTERAIAVLERTDLAGLFDEAIGASLARATELADGH